MADANQTQEAGGGEGGPASATQEAKPTANSSAPQDGTPADPIAEQIATKKEPEVNSAKPEASSIEVAKPAEPTTVPAVTSTAPEVPVPAPVELNAAVLVSEVPVPSAPASEAPVSVTPATSAVPVAEAVATAPPALTDQNANNVEQSTTSESNWQQRESGLLKKIEELEKVRNEKSEDGLKLELKVREEEIDLLKARVRNLETELHAALSKPSGKNHEMIENIKQQHEELLSKARGMIFDKTKMVKNQELQIEALTTQVQSLKDINLITKDLLEIRNSEVKAMEDRLQAMEARFKVEKERFGLVLQRAQTSNTLNDDLKKEYETQLTIFKELRVKYEQKVTALVAENEKLKSQINSGTGTSAQ